MLRVALALLILALIAGFFGYGGARPDFSEGARTLFFIFLVLAVLTFLAGFFRRQSFWRG